MHAERNSLAVILLFAFAFSSSTLFGQNEYQAYLEVHIDHVEEFIDRFNYYDDSRFHNYVETYYKGQDVNRKTVVNNMFNRKVSIPDSVKGSFVAMVTSKERPVYLDIYDALWYCKIPVDVYFESGEMIQISLSLEVQLNADYSIEWAIAGIEGDFFSDQLKNDQFFIASTSHASFFPELHKGLSEVDVFKQIISDNIRDDYIFQYANLISNDKVERIEIMKDISYHFLQIPGWIMVVKYRALDQSYNTGWLIEKLIPTESFKQKRIYQLEVLNVKNGY